MTRTHPRPASGKRRAAQGNGRLHRLLRYSHIFASAVREVLESKYLDEVSPEPLTLPQFHLLKLIALNGRHQVGEVAEFLGVSSPAASKNINKLQRMGLVTRTPSKGDRRATLLSASPKGRQLVERYETLKAERLTPVLQRFREQEVEQLSGLLEKFSVLLFDAEKSGDGFCLRCAAYCQESCPIGNVFDNCPYERIRTRTLAEQATREGLR